MINNGSPRSLTKYFIFNVERFAFMSRTCLRTVCHISHVMRDNKSLRSLMCLFNIEILSSDERVWITRVSWTGFPGMGPVTNRTFALGSTQKELTSITWERDVSLPSCMVGSIGNFLIAARLRVVEHVLRPVLSSIRVSMRSFGGDRVDMYTFFV